MPFARLLFIWLYIFCADFAQSSPLNTIDISTEHNSDKVESFLDPLHSLINTVFLVSYDILFYSTSNMITFSISLPILYKLFVYLPVSFSSTIWYLYSRCWIIYLVSKMSMILSICWGRVSQITTMSKYCAIQYKKCCEYGLNTNVFDFLVPQQNTDTKSITKVYLYVGSRYGFGATAKNGIDFCRLIKHK